MQNRKKEFLTIGILIILLLVIFNSFSKSAQNVSLEAQQQAYIDIVVSKSHSIVDVSHFEQDLKAELEKQGVNTQYVSVQKIDTESFSSNSADAAEILNGWGREGWPGQWYYEDNQVINAENTDDLTGFYYPDNFSYDDIDYQYENMSDNGDDDIMGCMFRFNKNADGTVTTYLLLMNKRDANGAFEHDDGLYKIVNKPFARASLEMVASTDATWTRNTWSKYRIVTVGNNIKIYQNDNLIINYTDPDPIYTGTYGFFSCSQPYARYRNIQIVTTQYKTYQNLLTEAKWKDNAIRLVVNAEDSINQEFQDEATLSDVIARMINQGIHYLGWGTSNNESQIRDLVEKNNNKGQYIDNTNYTKAIQETATYIKNLLAAYPTSQYLIVDEPIAMHVTPESAKNNTTDAMYPNGKWKAVHDEEYFENSNGKYSNSGRYQDAVMEIFDKAGKYEIYYEDQLIKELYLHRMPVAIIDSEIENNNVTLSSDRSFDIDKQSVNNGIQEVEWSYKKINDKSWTMGKLTKIEDGVNYLVRLRVKDYQNTWSKDAVRYISSTATKPIAQFEIVKSDITKYEELEVLDTSYDPAGRDITKEVWQVYKEDDKIYEGNTLITDYESYGAGEYKAVLTVTNSDGQVSDEFARQFTVMEDERPPEVFVDPAQEEHVHENITVNVNFTDKGGSGFNSYQYGITEERNETVQWSDWVSKSQDSITLTQKGNQYLHIKARDNAGNISEESIFGPYQIEEKKIAVEIEAMDEENNTLHFQDIQYEIMEPKVNNQEDDKTLTFITNAEGKDSDYLDIMKKDGQYTYVFRAITTPQGYETIGNTDIQVQYEKGKITTATSSNPKIEVILENEKIKINLKYTKLQVENPLQIAIQTVDLRDESTKLKGAEYQVEIQADSGEKFTTALTTNEEGIANLYPVGATGEIHIALKQTKTASGYKMQQEEKIITLHRDENTIAGITEKTSDDAEIYIENATNKVTIVVPNEKKEQNNYIRVQVVGSAEETLENMQFQLQQPLELAPITQVTDSTGTAWFGPIEGQGDGEETYILTSNQNNIYEFPEMHIPITFAEGKIVSTVQEPNIQVVVEENENEIQHILNIQYKANVKEMYQTAQKLKIIKQNQQNEFLANVTYDIYVKGTSFAKHITQQTNENGEIEIDLWKDNQLEITVQETSSLPGYSLDNTQKKITLVKSAEGTYTIQTDASVANVSEEAQTHHIVLKEINEKKAEKANHKANISLYITRKDQYHHLLGNVQFQVKEETTKQQYTLKTNENGIAELLDFTVPDVGTYVFTIEGITTTSGYIALSEPVKLQVIYGQNEQGEIKTTAISIIKGYEHIDLQQYNEYETQQNYQLDVNLTITDIAQEVEQAQTISFVKLGEGTILNDAEFKAYIQLADGMMIQQTGKTQEIAQFLQNTYIPEGSVKIVLKETKAQLGYRLDENEKMIEIQKYDGKIALLQDTENLVHWQEGNMQIQIENDTIGKDNIGGNFIEIEPTSYALVIKNENQYTPNFNLQGAVFEVTAKQNNQVMMHHIRGSNVEGIAEFAHIYASGDMVLEIKQTVAPKNYQINENVYQIHIARNINTQEIQVLEGTNEELEIQIDQINHKIIATIRNNLQQLTMGIITVDADDTTLRLANASYRVNHQQNYDANDAQTYGYGVTDNQGTVAIPITTYVQEGTATYEITQLKVPDSYEKQEKMALQITVDKQGNITQAIRVEGTGECIVSKVENNYVEIIVKNKKQAKPTYQVVVQTYNAYKPSQIVEQTKLDVEIQQQEGDTVRSTMITNTANGQATLRGIIGEGQIEIHLQELQSATGYLLNSKERVVYLSREVTLEEEGTYYQKLSTIGEQEEGIEVIIDNTKQQVTIRIACIPILGLTIEKVDKQDSSIKIQDVIFVLEQNQRPLGTATTNTLGKAFIAFGETPSNQTIVYTLKEMEGANGYQTIPEDIQITVTYSLTGEITSCSITKGSQYATIVQQNEQGYIELQVTNIAEEQTQDDMALQVNKVTEEQQLIPVENAVFQIHTESEDGKIMNAVKTTNEEGKIRLDGIIGEGKIKIELQELEVEDEYALDNTVKTIVVQKEKGKLKLISEETTEGMKVLVDEKEKLVSVTITNSISTRVIGLSIFKVEEKDTLTMLKADFQVEDEETKEKYVLSTKGTSGDLVGLPLKDKGTYRYVIQEIKTPDGFETITQDIILQVTYRQLGEIENIEIIQGNGVASIEKQTSHYIELHIKNTPKEADILPYAIKIVKVDSEDKNIKLSGGEFHIEVTNEEGMTYLSKRTGADQNGEITIKQILSQGNATFTIQELMPPEGRKYDSTKKEINAYIDKNTGRIEVINTNGLETVIDQKQRIITIYVKNELEDGLYQLSIAKKDKEQPEIHLGNVHMKIQLPGEETAREVVTDVDGKIHILNIQMPEPGEYEYTIEEIKTAEGYTLLQNPVKMKVEFTQEGEQMWISNAKITANTENANILTTKKQQVLIELLNEPKEEYVKEQSYEIQIHKVDSQNQEVGIKGAKIKVYILQNDANTKQAEVYTNEEGKIILNHVIITDNGKITVEEVEAPKGYDLDGSVREIPYVLQNGKLVLMLAEDDIQVTANDKKIEMKMTNDANNQIADLHIEKFVSKINNQEITNTMPIVTKEEDGSISYKKSEQMTKVQYGDIVEFTMRIYNSGKEDGYASYILDKVPDGLRLIEDNEINKQAKWQQTEEGYATSILSSGEENKIKGYDASFMELPDYKEIKIVFQVQEKTDTQEATAINTAIVTGEEEPGIYALDNESTSQVEIEYIKLKTDKYITMVNLNGENKQVDMGKTKAGDLFKVEVVGSKVKRSVLTVQYQIEVTNEGTTSALVEEIRDYIPEGMTFLQEDNPEWKVEQNYVTNQIKQELAPGETIQKTITLKWYGSTNEENMGLMVNKAAAIAQGDINEAKIDEASLTISVKTGAIESYIMLFFIGTSIVAIGIIGIKKYILGKA